MRGLEGLFPKFQPSRVTITTNSGQSHSMRVDVPKGDPRDPMTEEEIAVKFTALGGDVIGQDQMQEVAELHHEYRVQGPWRTF